MSHTEHPVSRRGLIRLGGKAAAAGMLGSALLARPGAAATTSPDAWPTAPLPASAADTVVSSQFISAEQLAAWGAEADALGLRATGAPNHEAYIRTLAGRFQQAGLQDIRLDPVPLRRWTAKSWGITVDGKTLDHTYYAPTTQATGPAGVTAPMAYLPAGDINNFLNNPLDTITTLLNPKRFKGKIVVFEVPYLAIPLLAFQALSYPGAWQTQGENANQVYKRPWLNAIPQILDYCAKQGAVGTIGIWPDLPGDWAKQYTPYDHIFRPIPSLWIDRDGGAALSKRATAGASATLRLEADVVDTTTTNLIGFIPGMSDELTVMHTHTDGTNGMEENGQNGILAATQYLTRLPKERLPRTIMVLLSAGHFAGGAGIKSFLTTHANDLVPRTTSILTLEHLGCTEWKPSGADIKPTGKPELAASFTPNAPAVIAALKAANVSNAIPGSVIKPFYPAPTTDGPTKHGTGWPGEGTYFWWYGGLLDGNTISGPYGLITADLNTTGMVDYELMRRESMTAVKTVLQLAAASKADLTPR